MKKRTLLPPLIVALLLGTGATLAWNKREAAWQEDARFTARRLTLLEEENTRLRTSLEQHLKAAREARNLKLREEIEERTAQLRGLEFKEPVTYESLSRDALKGKLISIFDKEYTPAQFESMQQGYAAMGLIPEGVDLRKVILNLLDEQIAAFYDQHASELFMFEDSSLDSAKDRMILSHELVHALQDQHFDLSSFPIETKTNDDLALAAFSLVEGDATVLMQDFFQGEASIKGAGELLKALFMQKYEHLSKAPAFLRESLLFRYQAGATFCQALMNHGSGGYTEITNAYGRLPSSSTQILHPEKYFAEEEPLTIRWQESKLDGQKASFENVAGEFGFIVLLKEWGFPKNEAERIATGWRGDRYLHWKDAGALVWKSAWATPAKAAEVASALETVLAKRYNTTFESTGETASRTATATPRGLAIVQPSATEVLLVNVTEKSSLPVLLQQFGR